MPTRNVNLPEALDRSVLTKVKSGRYENASEVVRAALRTLEREEQEHEAKLVALRAAIDEGDTSGIAGSGIFSRVRKLCDRLTTRDRCRRSQPSARQEQQSAGVLDAMHVHFSINPFNPSKSR
jgi:putative addiction module CopG family antidote